MKTVIKPDQKKWLVIIVVFALLSLLVLLLRTGFGIWPVLFLILWVVLMLVFLFVRFPNPVVIKAAAGILFTIAVVSALIISSPVTNTTEQNAGKTSSANSCPDNDLHSKKVASGETVYWKCTIVTIPGSKPYAQLTVQVAEGTDKFPYNQKTSAASSGKDIRLYCLTYKLKGKEVAGSSCSSFSDYTKQMTGCNSPEACYQRNSAGPAGWIMPFVPDTIVGAVYMSTSKDVQGIESIEQLLIYPTSGFDSKGGTDIREAPSKYQPLIVINLN